MAKSQTEMFPTAPRDADDELSAAQAELRRAQFAREATRPTEPRPRGRRHRAVRAKTINMKRISRRAMAIARELLGEDEEEPRPRTRAECLDGPRPCPFVGCRHHLYLDVSEENGSIRLNFPDVPAEGLEELPATCSLDVAANGGVTLEQVGAFTNLTRERVRQIELKSIGQLAATREIGELRDLQGGAGKRRLPVLEREASFDVDGFVAGDD